MALSDAELLEQWAVQRNTGALTEWVSRHLPMVYGTCRRSLHDAAKADSIVQACFLEIAAAPAYVRRSLAGALHAAAVRLSVESNPEDRRPKRDTAPDVSRLQPSWDDLREFVDLEITALDDKFREPVVLRFLEAQLEADIAQHLGLSRAIVQRRLEQGIDRVCKRLRKRGFLSLNAAIFTALLASHAAGASPATLADAVVKRVVNEITPTAATESAKRKLHRNKSVIAAVLIMLLVMALAAVFVLPWRQWIVQKPPPPKEAGPAAPAAPPPASKPLTASVPAAPAAIEESDEAPPLSPEESARAINALFLAAFQEKVESARLARDDQTAPLTSGDIPPNNGAHYFLLAAELFPNINRDRFFSRWEEIRAGNWTDVIALRDLLDAVRSSLDAVRSGLEAAHAILPLARGPHEPSPYLQTFRDIARVMALEAEMRAANGDYAAAFDNLAAIFEFANESARGGGMANGAAGFAIDTTAADAVREMLPWLQGEPLDYSALIEGLQTADEHRYSLAEMAASETQSYQAWLQSEFKSIPELRRALLQTDPKPEIQALLSTITDRDLQERFHDAVQNVQGLLDYAALPYYEAQNADVDAYLDDNPLSRLLLSPVQQAAANAARADALVRGTLLMTAIQAYTADNQAYPASLDELAPRYLPKLPVDPFSGDTFLYHLTDSGYILYSTGMNMQDDGGQAAIAAGRSGDLVINKE